MMEYFVSHLDVTIKVTKKPTIITQACECLMVKYLQALFENKNPTVFTVRSL
jgi:hypothetical protein